MGLFDSIGSFLGSIFTPHNQNANDAWYANQQDVASKIMALMPEVLANAKTNIGHSQDASNALYDFTTPHGMDEQTSFIYNLLRSKARQGAGEASTAFSGNPELGKAFGLDQLNQANTSAADYTNQLNSPQGRLAAIRAYLASLGGQTAAIAPISALRSAGSSSPPPIGQNAAGPILGDLIGALGGGPAGAAIGGALGGGYSSSMPPGSMASGSGGVAGPSTMKDPTFYEGL